MNFSKSLFIALALIFIFSSYSYAANVDLNVAITEIGTFPAIANQDINRSATRLKLDDPTDTYWTGGRYFYLSYDMGSEGAATALTAFAMGKQVWVRLSGEATGSIINIIFITAIDAI